MRTILFLLLLTACGQDSSGSSEPGAKPIDQTLAAEQGQPGAKGEKGDAGPAGKDGAPGKDGKTIPVTSDMWFDPIEKKYWLMGGTGNYAAAELACSGQWEVPSLSETMLAISRGLPKPTANFAFYTSTDGNQGEKISVYLNGITSQASSVSTPVAGINAIRCVESKSQF